MYRVDIEFEARSGRLLGRYGFYHRRLPPVLAPPRLAVNSATLSPGETLFARVENMSPKTVYYGVAYRIDRRNGPVWEPALQTPRGPWIMIGLHSSPGGTGRCSAFRIPADMPAGEYRIVKRVGPSLGRSSRTVATPFTVVRENQPLSREAGPRTTRRGP